MSEQTRAKSRSLLKSTREEIARFAADNPLATQEEIAKRFTVKVSQVRNAIKQKQTGALDRKRYRQPVKQIKETMDSMTVEDIIEHQYHYAAASLKSATWMSADELITSLQKLVSIRTMIFRNKLTSHIKGADADFVAFVYRKDNPNLTEDEIIKIFEEDMERWKTAKKWEPDTHG